MSPPVFLSAMCLCLMVQAEAADVNIITAEAGQNVTLTCKVTVNNNNNITAVEWIRSDPKTDGSILLCRNGDIDNSQLPSYKGRVSLPDKWMETGDVSLILKNVKNKDNGTYECDVRLEVTNRRRKRAADTTTTVRLTVTAAGHKEPQSGGDKGGVSQSHVVGSVVGGLVLVAVMVGVVVVGVVLYRVGSGSVRKGFALLGT